MVPIVDIGQHQEAKYAENLSQTCLSLFEISKKSKYTTTHTQKKEAQTISEHLQSQSMASPYFTFQIFFYIYSQ